MCVMKHKVQYYETDMMQVVHHSNYIRWFEEARTELLGDMGFPYHEIESSGILIPVLSASAEYKKPCKFGEVVCIDVDVVEYNGVKLSLEYTIWDEDKKEVRTTGNSSHCFVDSSFKLVSPKRCYKELHEALMASLQRSNTNRQEC